MRQPVSPAAACTHNPNLHFMKFYKFIFFYFILIVNTYAQEYNIIPFPAQLNASHEKLDIPAELVIVNNDERCNEVAGFLKQYLEERKIKSATSTTHQKNNKIVLQLINQESLGEEGYTLLINKNGIQLLANTPAGIFYAAQTLMQILPQQPGSKLSLNYVQISDVPRFAWRGLHLDVSRHFFSVDFIKKYIDLMSMYKFNTFHWHLTEDQGWRIEIKKYPLLTEIGSKRKETILEKNFNPYIGDNTPYEGFYTQEQIKEVVAYASSRHVTIVPEIEMPGHALAALAAYPQLGCTGGPYEVGTVWGVYDDVFCAGNDETFIFLENVLDEVLELFPSKYIHIGGDECPKTRWKTCTKCQNRIKKEGLHDEHELQSYFIRRIEKYLNAKDRNLIGWDEILEGGLAPNATVMSWRGEEGGIEAAKAGHDVVMTPGFAMYFDHYQGDPAQEPLAICCFTDLQKVYHYEPVPSRLNEEEAKHILGAQANVWTEYMKTSEHVEYMIFPRLLALSEVVWTNPARKNWTEFQQRIKLHFEMLDKKKVNFRIPEPGLPSTSMVIMQPEIEVSITMPFENALLYYTTDGTPPTIKSMPYTSAIKLKLEPGERKTIQAITIYKDRKSIVSKMSIERQQPAQGEKLRAISPGIKLMIFDGQFKTVESITEGKNVSTINLENISLPTETKGLNAFGMIAETYIKIEKEGIYTFFMGSDDGSKLFINKKLVVDNDGLHGFEFQSGQISLGEGYHPLQLFYFDAGGARKLELEWEGPGFTRSKIDNNRFYYTKQ